MLRMSYCDRTLSSIIQCRASVYIFNQHFWNYLPGSIQTLPEASVHMRSEIHDICIDQSYSELFSLLLGQPGTDF